MLTARVVVVVAIREVVFIVVDMPRVVEGLGFPLTGPSRNTSPSPGASLVTNMRPIESCVTPTGLKQFVPPRIFSYKIPKDQLNYSLQRDESVFQKMSV